MMAKKTSRSASAVSKGVDAPEDGVAKLLIKPCL